MKKNKFQISLNILMRAKFCLLFLMQGTPLLSDPGGLLINKCIENKIVKVVQFLEPSSITAAMSVSGFRDQFLFYGFLPKTENELEKVLVSLSQNSFSQVFFIPALK